MFDLSNIVGAVGYLVIHVNDISKVMIKKKEKFDKNGKTEVVKTEMVAQKAAADDFGKAILARAVFVDDGGGEADYGHH